jgi:Uma2 family endonuclease
MRSVLEPLLQSPELPDYVEELARTLARERQRRERFYEELTEDGSFEFINGEVIMHSPARDKHTLVVQNLVRLLSAHVEMQALGLVRSEKALCVFPRNDYEPDVVFFGRKKAQTITGDTRKYPVPDFIVEVLSESTKMNDRGVKFQDYAAHGVREYWIVDPDAETIERHILKDGRYPKARAQKSGIVESETVAGFRIPLRAIFDARASFTTLRQLLK